MGLNIKFFVFSKKLLEMKSALLRLFIESIFISILIIIVATTLGCAPSHRMLASGVDRTLHLGIPLWSPSGSHILIDQSGIDSPEKLLCINVTSRRTAVVAENAVIESWAWSPQCDQICYISLSANARRTLHITDTSGRMLHEVDVPPTFSSIGLEWTRKGHVVVLDSEDDHHLLRTVIRIFSEKLKEEKEFMLPFPVYDIQLCPKSAENIVAIAGGKYDRNVVYINLNTKKYQQITNVGNIPIGRGCWKFVEPDEVYFIEQDVGKYSSNGLYIYDTKTSKVQLITSCANLGGQVAHFDVFNNKAAVDTLRGLYLVDFATHHISSLVKSKNCNYPMFSPDGKKLAFVNDMRKIKVKDLHNTGDTLLYVAK